MHARTWREKKKKTGFIQFFLFILYPCVRTYTSPTLCSLSVRLLSTSV